MKEYLWPIDRLARDLDAHCSILSCGLGFNARHLTPGDWRKLARIINTKMNSVDPGPWRSGQDTPNGRVFIESNDFTHDVRLYVDGNFRDEEHKLSYASAIARELNSPFLKDRQWGSEWTEWVGDSAAWDREILITAKDFYADGRPDPFALTRMVRRSKGRVTWSHYDQIDWQPTHWRNLPEGPKEEEVSNED